MHSTINIILMHVNINLMLLAMQMLAEATRRGDARMSAPNRVPESNPTPHHAYETSACPQLTRSNRLLVVAHRRPRDYSWSAERSSAPRVR